MFLSPVVLASIWSLACESLLLLVLYLVYRGPKENRTSHIFFNPQDYAKAHPEAKLPEYSKEAKFDPFITQYTGMGKVIIGLAAASISFGGLHTTEANVLTAKILHRICACFLYCGHQLLRELPA